MYKDSQKDVAEKLQEVKEREAELQESIQKGDTDKVAKRERKLAEAKTELQEAEAELKTFKDAL